MLVSLLPHRGENHLPLMVRAGAVSALVCTAVHMRECGRCACHHIHGGQGAPAPCAQQCWAPSSIVGSVVSEITPRKYELFYEVGPDRPALVRSNQYGKRWNDLHIIFDTIAVLARNWVYMAGSQLHACVAGSHEVDGLTF